MNEFVTCRICGKERRELNGRHLRMHGITPTDYKRMYPDAVMVSEASSLRKSNARETTALKLSIALKARHQRERAENPEKWLAKQQAAAKLARLAKGPDYRHSAVTLEKMKGPRPQCRGMKHSDEHRAKLSQARKGRRFRPHSPATIAKMKEAWERRRSDAATYSEYLRQLSERMSSPEAKKRVRDRTAKLIQEGRHNGKSKDTRLELRFKAYLEEQQIDYEHQFVVETRKGAFTFDFMLQKSHLLVEVDGEYWHTKTLEVWNRDKLKQRLASELGFAVARISDKNWRPEIIHQAQDTIEAANEAILEDRHRRIMARKAT